MRRKRPKKRDPRDADNEYSAYRMIKKSGLVDTTMLVVLFPLFIVLCLLFFVLPMNYAFIALLGVVVFIISFVSTDLALIILILSTIFSPEFSTGGVTGRSVSIRADDIFVIVIFCGWIAKMAINKEMGLIRSTPLNLPIISYILVCVISSGLGMLEGYTKPKESFFYLLKYIEYFLIYFMVVNNLKNYKQAKRFIFFLLLVCFAVSIFAWSRIPSGERLTAPFEGKEGGEPSTFAAYLLLMMMISMGSFIFASSLSHKLVYMGVFCMAIVPFVLTLSRGGWLGFFPAYFSILLWTKRMRIPLAAALIAVVITLPHIMPAKVHERMKETFNPEQAVKVGHARFKIAESAAARINSWPVAFDKVYKKPLLGWGVPCGSTIDNQYARVMSETGLIGFAIFAWLIVSLYQAGVRSYALTRDAPFAQGICLGYLAALTALLFQSFAAAIFILIRVMEPFWILSGIVVMLPRLIAEGEGGQVNG